MDEKSPDTHTSVSGQAPYNTLPKPEDLPEPKVSMAGYVFWAIMVVLNCCPALGILMIILGISSASSGIKDLIDIIKFIFLLPLGIHKWPPP